MLENTHTKSSFRRIGWVGGIFLTLMLLAAAVERKKELTVAATDVEVEPLEAGALLIDSADVIRIIERSFGSTLDGQAAGAVDLDRVERVLEEDEGLFVKNAEVVLTANSRIHIKVEQREPVLRIFDNLGSTYYLDGAGSKVKWSRHYTTRTLVAMGNIPPYTPEFLTKKKHPLKDLFELTQRIQQDFFWKAMIEQIYVNGKNEYILVPKIGDQVILLGKYEEVDEKLKKLRTFYDEGMNREGWRQYKTLDLRYQNQVVCSR